MTRLTGFLAHHGILNIVCRFERDQRWRTNRMATSSVFDFVTLKTWCHSETTDADPIDHSKRSCSFLSRYLRAMDVQKCQFGIEKSFDKFPGQLDLFSSGYVELSLKIIRLHSFAPSLDRKRGCRHCWKPPQVEQNGSVNGPSEWTP